MALFLLFKCSLGALDHYPKTQSHAKTDHLYDKYLNHFPLFLKSSTQYLSLVFYNQCITFRVGPGALACMRSFGLNWQAVLLDRVSEKWTNWTVDTWLAHLNIFWRVRWKWHSRHFFFMLANTENERHWGTPWSAVCATNLTFEWQIIWSVTWLFFSLCILLSLLENCWKILSVCFIKGVWLNKQTWQKSNKTLH